MPIAAEQHLGAVFAAALGRLGPFGPAPRLAAGVSGGADSTALALLADEWAGREGGSLLALIVDHGLRDGSAAEAVATQARLVTRGIQARVLTLHGLAGPGLQARARAARHAALAAAARRDGRLHLLLGHQARDQAETVAMRQARGSRGGEGMPSWAARQDVVLLRPLLRVAPETLRDFLRQAGMAWVEDPSNADPRFERARLRQVMVAAAPEPEQNAARRQAEEREAAWFLAAHAVLRPEGFAVLDAEAAPVAALAALLRVVGGADYPPDRWAVARLAARLRPATLGGVRIMAAGRLGPGWLLAREAASCAGPGPARDGGVWDGRFRLSFPPVGAVVAACGQAAGADGTGLPAAVRRVLPCLRGCDAAAPAPAWFAPPQPATSHPFLA